VAIVKVSRPKAPRRVDLPITSLGDVRETAISIERLYATGRQPFDTQSDKRKMMDDQNADREGQPFIEWPRCSRF
jgi:hypothetical protein